MGPLGISATARAGGALLLLVAAATGQAAAQSGADVYARTCAGCHGAQMQGTAWGPPLSPQSYRYGGRREDLERVIRNGVAERGMPAFGDTLSNQQIAALVEVLPARESEPQPTPEEVEAEAAAQPHEFDPTPGVASTLDYAVRAEIFADGLETVWALAFIDADTALATERAGRLRVIRNGVLQPEPVSGVPEVFVHSHMWNQGGLLDVAVDPNHAENGWIYLAYSHRLPGTGSGEGVDSLGLSPEEVLERLVQGGVEGAEPLAMTRVIRGRIRDNAWVDEEVVFEADPSEYGAQFWHYGGRIIFDREGRLYVSVGDRGAQEQVQELARSNGKIHRVMPDGSIPRDNPFRSRREARPSVFSYGHRNPQGMTIDPATGRIWATEHGPRGGDELNVIKRGADYGWPVVSHGINYDGTILTPHTRSDGVEQPAYFWRPSIGVSGVAFYDGEEFPLWRGKLLVTSLARRNLRLLTVDGERVQHEEVIFTSEGRPYEPVVGPDGAIYLVTDDPGQIIRLTADEERKL